MKSAGFVVNFPSWSLNFHVFFKCFNVHGKPWKCDSFSPIEILETASNNGGTVDTMRRKSLVELLVILIPFSNTFIFLYLPLYYLSMDLPILLISMFPASSRSYLTIPLCLILDTLALGTLFVWGIYVFFIILSFVLSFQDSVDLAIRKISR